MKSVLFNELFGLASLPFVILARHIIQWIIH